ncbi:MAG: EF-P lysine aminoacylase GenX [Magnetococcales bacterium]|nr:EF-P lysine aminoacylase GenX [Magnetococcales bacterium]
MSLAPSWRPTANLDTMRARADILNQIRRFFQERDVLEVDVPCMAATVAPEPNLEPLACALNDGLSQQRRTYLLTSPETYLKRFVAAEKIAVYSMGHAFRNDERGALHNPEFTMLEWYRPLWSLQQLRQETELLIRQMTGCPPAQHVRYQQLFLNHAGVDPFSSSDAEIFGACVACGHQPPSGLDRLGLLDFLMVMVIEPNMVNYSGLLSVDGFPAERAAMAEIDPGPPAVACRFEFYLNGIELANGYQELTDSSEQRSRLEQANHQRLKMGQVPLPLDEAFLSAMQSGFPRCAGVALGVDRLVMCALQQDHIQKVIPFAWCD